MFRKWRIRHPMENLIPIVVKFPADWLLTVNWAQPRLFWAILDQPRVRKMYRKGPHKAANMQIDGPTCRFGSLYLRDVYDVVEKRRWVGFDDFSVQTGPLILKVLPEEVAHNVKHLAPKPDEDGTEIEEFGNIIIKMPFKTKVYIIQRY